MHATVRRAGPADAALIAEFNRLLALESENSWCGEYRAQNASSS